MTQPTVTFDPPNLVMVLDKSGSMLQPFAGSTRWDTLVSVVQGVTGVWDSRIKFGAKVFPSAADCVAGSVFSGGAPLVATGDACEVTAGFAPSLAPAIDNGLNIVTALPTAAQIDAGCWTPTDFGYLRSYEALTAAVPGGEPSALMLVIDGLISDGISDGTKLCQGPQLGVALDSTQLRLTDAISASLVAGIPTYVVAIDAGGAGTVADANLYAQLGGRPNPDPTFDYYPGDDLTGLQNAMDAIAAEVATCEVQLDVPPPNPSLIEVSVEGTMYDEISAANCAADIDGWYYSVQYTEVTLCGTACDDFKALATPVAQIDYYCISG